MNGKIIVSVTSTEQEGIIEVLDNGKGLPEEGQSRLTEPYMTTRVKGTGLGLAIVRKAVEEHGGTFTIQDGGPEGGPGATARIALPLHAEPSDDQPASDKNQSSLLSM